MPRLVENEARAGFGAARVATVACAQAAGNVGVSGGKLAQVDEQYRSCEQGIAGDLRVSSARRGEQ